MSQRLLGYALDGEIFRSDRTVVYRAQRAEGGERAVVKVLREPRPTAERIAWFRREFDVLRSLDDVEGALRAYAVGQDGDHWAMALEDIGGTSLLDLVRDRPLPVDTVLRAGTQLAGTLAAVHRRDVVHKDINPSNVIFNKDTGQIRLIDFGIATLLSREAPSFDTPNVHEGTLDYISPEQTGRMNRSVDYRTDLYSLGATLYHLLTGRPLFVSQDPLELVHAHIARVPAEPAKLRPDVPQVLSDIVMRLLAKTAEERYQSAESLQADLAECARRLAATGRVAPFELDRTHRPIHLVLPQKLYGRDADIQRLLVAFEAAAAGGVEVTLVAGYSGVGKSSLVQELYAPITRSRGYFIAGKFEELHRDIPYASLLHAFRSLLRQILAESEERIATWRRRILGAVGPNGQVLIDVLPELELLLGPQPPAAALSALEVQTRFEHVLTRFIEVIARREHPLALFLDDLQWVDPGSLKVLEALLLRSDVKHLLVLGAYRDNEVSPGHPLLLTLDRIRHGGTNVNNITLGPLTSEDVLAFVSDAVSRPPEEARPLAELIAAKSHGNPFFLRELMKSLHVEGLLVLKECWTWDVAAIAAHDITDNVVELMAEALRGLPEETREALCLAGALGNNFDLSTLAVASGLDRAPLWRRLWPALVEGMILTLDDAYKLIDVPIEGVSSKVDVRCRFAHDRVQQAAYALVPGPERAAMHWAMGRKMLDAWVGPALEERLFDVVGHLNAGRHLCDGQGARDELAGHNLRAAHKAKASAAFAAALEHARVGLELLGEARFERRYDLALGLVAMAVETSYQTGDFEQMDRWFDEGVARARDVIDTAWMQEIKTEALNAQGKPLAALDHALDYLQKLGVDCPRQPGPDDVGAEMKRAMEALAGRTPDDLARPPDIADPSIRAAVSLICKIYSSAYVASPLVFAVVTLKQFQLVAKHGNCPVSSLVYAVFGLLQAGLAGDLDAGYAFGALSSRLLDRPAAARFKAQALHLFNCHTRFWREHVRCSADGERAAYRVGLETGEMEFGCYGGHVATKYAFFHGQDLGEVKAEAEQYTQAMRRYRIDIALSSHAPWHQTVQNLVEPTEAPWRLAGPVHDDEAARPRLVAANDRMAISNGILARLLLSYLFERFDEAVALADEGAGYLDSVLSQFNQPLHYFYDALARLAALPAAPPEPDAHMRKVDEDLERLRGFAASAPVNFAQKIALIEAERLRVLERPHEARDLYDEAIHLAQRHEFLSDEALACEVAGRFHLERRPRLAHHYLHDACDAYARWGAVTKVNDLEARHPHLILRAPAPAPRQPAARGTVAVTARGASIDLESVLRASQAISGEVVLPELLGRIMAVVLQNAGARRGLLILRAARPLVVVADATAPSTPRVDIVDGDIAHRDDVAHAIVRYVERTRERVVLADAARTGAFQSDPDVVRLGSRSILCLPVLHHNELAGVLYLDNDLVANAFTPDRCHVLELLAAQAAISLENARLYETLENRVRERTRALSEALDDLRRTQRMLVAQEKLASLGMLTSGIAHELKNPLNFVVNFSGMSLLLLDDLRDELSEVMGRLGDEAASIEELLADLRQNATKVREHGHRADQIVRAMLQHAGSASGRRDKADLNKVVEDAVRTAIESLRVRRPGFSPEVKTTLDPSIPPIYFAPQEIGQVVVNLVGNACDALWERAERDASGAFAPEVAVSTRDAGDAVEIRVRDNGTGIPAEVAEQIFLPFFTTKPTGQGTGLGLSLSHDIVVGHHGALDFTTREGEGTELVARLPKVIAPPSIRTASAAEDEQTRA